MHNRAGLFPSTNMYSIEIPKLRKNQFAVVLHHPSSAGHYSAHAEVVVVASTGDWLSRAEVKFGSDIRLYEGGSAFLGLGAYSRPINGTWEKFTPEQISDKNECVRAAPVQ